MSLKLSITEEMKKALKAKDRQRTSVLRFILSSIKNKEIELKRELKDEEVVGVLASLAKQRKEAIEQFRKGSREDLASKEEGELRIITSFMPPPLTEEEIERVVKECIERLGAKGRGDMGRVMREVMSEVKGRAEGKVVKEVVERLLG